MGNSIGNFFMAIGSSLVSDSSATHFNYTTATEKVTLYEQQLETAEAEEKNALNIALKEGVKLKAKVRRALTKVELKKIAATTSAKATEHRKYVESNLKMWKNLQRNYQRQMDNSDPAVRKLVAYTKKANKNMDKNAMSTIELLKSAGETSAGLDQMEEKKGEFNDETEDVDEFDVDELERALNEVDEQSQQELDINLTSLPVPFKGSKTSYQNESQTLLSPVSSTSTSSSHNISIEDGDD